QVFALDVSAEALGVARDNAERLGLAQRVRLIEGSFPAAARGLPPFDAIAANPPYIPNAEIDALQPEVRDWEPRLALNGGPDGLSLLRALADDSAALLNPGGWLVTEVALGQ